MMKIKLFTVVVFLLCTSNLVFGQNTSSKNSKSKIGVTFSTVGSNDIVSNDLICDCGYNSDYIYGVGITYIYAINHWLDLEVGIEYTKQTVQAYSIIPDAPKPDAPSDLNLLVIPLTGRANFLNYFFVNAGLLVSFDVSNANKIVNQSGLGLMAGIGARYSFNNDISIFVNPYVKRHAMISFSGNGDRRKLVASGFRFGITYSL